MHNPPLARKESCAPLNIDLLLQPIRITLPVLLCFRDLVKRIVDAVAFSTSGPALAVRMCFLLAVETTRGPDVLHFLGHRHPLLHGDGALA